LSFFNGGLGGSFYFHGIKKNAMKGLIFFCINSFLLIGCQAQTKPVGHAGERQVGGPCEGCEAIYEWGNKRLLPVDTLPGFFESGGKLKISGTVYKKDGKTPASGVIVYIYHTGPNGVYAIRGNEQGWGRRHGYHRGWIKTGDDGSYAFYTIKPGPYPGRKDPAHIHVTIKEPEKNEYYIDDFLFENDPLLSKEEKNKPYPKGGRGIVTLYKENGISIAKRNIILGLNISNYE
jgi:protocatechuate 3,4-dioxygenase, beta subunit